MRIEVGYGLEGTLTDVAASRIIRNVMTPQFKAGDYDKGVEDGVDAIIAQLEGRRRCAARRRRRRRRRQRASRRSGCDDARRAAWPMRILLGAFIFGIIGLFTFVGIMTPGVGWFLYVFLIPFWAMFPIMILGVRGALSLLGIYVVGFPIAKLILVAHRVVPEGAEGDEDQGLDDDRRLHDERAVERRQLVVRQRAAADSRAAAAARGAAARRAAGDANAVAARFVLRYGRGRRRGWNALAYDVVGDAPALRDALGLVERPVDAEIDAALAVLFLRLRQRCEAARQRAGARCPSLSSVTPLNSSETNVNAMRSVP